jgi:hypothetical protein
MSKKEAVLFGQYTKMNYELKQLEEVFKKRSAQYDKAYRSVMTNMATCRKHCISNEEYKQVPWELSPRLLVWFFCFFICVALVLCICLVRSLT